jgi:hypothetical protein
MTEFEYLSVLYSITVAYSLSEIFACWGRMIRNREFVTIYWVHIAAMFLIAALIIQFWWSTWQYRDIPLTFLDFTVVLLAPLTYVLIASVLTPQITVGVSLDCKKYYYTNHSWMYLLSALVIVELGIADYTVTGEDPIGVKNAIRLGAIAFICSLGVVKNERFHTIVLSILSVLLVLFIALGTFTLQDL